VSRIISILPKGEGFSPTQFGAISLCVRDFTYYSCFRQNITVIGGVKGPGFEHIDYVSVKPARWYENRTRAYARNCVRIIKEKKAQLVEIHNRPNLLVFIAPKISCKIALHLHNDPQEMTYARTKEERKKLLSLCDAIYCVSDYIRIRFLEGVDETLHAKVHVIYNGISLPATIPEKDNVIVFAGRMTEGKGALILAEALSTILPKLPDWKAVFIGSRRHSTSQTPTSYERKILDILDHLGAQVHMTGFIPHSETMALFARAAIAVIPSIWQEPFGRTAIEAMAEGCAVISSGRGGLLEVTRNNALIPETLTARSLADAIGMLTRNETIRKEYQSLARERAKYFSIAERTHTLDDVRDSILKG
jgi:glycosyltransferase involved in cell wall biosynthesis